MNAEKHAKALRILSFIYSTIQFFIFLLLAAYVLVSIAGLLFAYNNVAPMQWVLAATVAAVFGLVALIGLLTAILNFRLGLRLRLRMQASRRLVIATAIVNIASFLTGAIVILPAGIALGIYGIWFGLSEAGRSYLQGRSSQDAVAYASAMA